ncbi:MAG: DUF5110 domain-containing protein [Lachnospiraceae bacterium]|nr:DUF5110 domain-containing protein [Lachnospiraceae bacterium]
MIKNNLWKMEPVGREENTVRGEHYRFTLLTPCLIRMEYREDGAFEDRPTQIVWNRRFDEVPFRLVRDGEGFDLFTEQMHITYDGQRFSPNGLTGKALGGLHPYGNNWRYGENGHNLGGTARTLDEADGACSLSNGIQAITGCSVLDDSQSLLLTEEGWVEPRRGEGIDLYLFAYGSDYKQALKAFYRLTGNTLMLPRYALGNWWSRYYAYTEESYMELVNRFQAEEIPFTVAVIDMDWHLVEEVDPKYGSGWTGYTWNRTLFPDPERFLSWLHAHGMRTTLNLHPADGIRAFEEAYPRMAESLGNVDTEHEAPIDFDITNPKFLEAYFDCVLHPEEDRGVDFWWIDWQQGNTTKIPGLDPLWMLNHYHYLDNARDGKRPMTFSRYAGPGSHRYPIGFSGDTVMTWASLDFQPYFTSTASNIGYGWWSHDIGGHMRGYKNNDMAARWLQYGVFSPINRLHSSKSEFNGKEPWRYPEEIAGVMTDFLRLRHELLPYLYTMNYRAYQENLPLTLPMYYDYPTAREAYQVKNQYLFGTAFLVAPITTPEIAGIDRGKVHVWLPEGRYIDFFTGMLYSGGRELDMYRDIHSIPVLAKAGAIVPTTPEIIGQAATGNPRRLSICVFGGADGTFTLYEDDNETCAYQSGDCAMTAMAFDWEQGIFTIEGAKGNLTLLPEERIYEVCFYGVKDSAVVAEADGERVEVQKEYDPVLGCLRVGLPELPPGQSVRVTILQAALRENDVTGQVFDLLNRAEIDFVVKEKVYSLVKKTVPTSVKVAELHSQRLDAELAGAVTEILTAYVK